MAFLKIIRTAGKGSEQLKHALKAIKGHVGKVGWFPSAQYPDGTPVAQVAAVQEFGNPSQNIPPRSFMRTTIAAKEKKWARTIQAGAKLVLQGDVGINAVLEAIVLEAAGDIRKKITQIQEPPLAPATIAARVRKMADTKTVGNLTKPLVETKILLNTLTGIVEKK